ncbi:hypothetical protein [Aquimarina intermedia]|uniref:Lipoprotein n=1 Tax=Aquimarina intermedia TaxID=350814 RepID=A0A5S5BWH8_9FLAO|nr:hypothetical protein [Aquimarina intermedia]TYP71541.1 hypothetical protein BD809_109123 [Aquimarina intermedia]
MSSKIISSIIFLATNCFFFGCGEKPISTIIQMSKEEVLNIFPENFEVKHNGERMEGYVYINDTLKLQYSTSIMSMMSSRDEIDNLYIGNKKIDTIQNRILRVFKEKKIGKDKYNISFQMIDLRSKDIPTIFGNPSNPKILYTVLDLYTNIKHPLSKNEKDALIQSIFHDSILKLEK